MLRRRRKKCLEEDAQKKIEDSYTWIETQYKLIKQTHDSKTEKQMLETAKNIQRKKQQSLCLKSVRHKQTKK